MVNFPQDGHPVLIVYNLCIFRLVQLFMSVIILILVLLILCLGDIIWENCNEIFGDFLTRAPVQHDGKDNIDHEH